VIVATFLLLFLLLWMFFYAAGPLFERVLRRSAHWTAAFRYRDYLPVLVVVAIGIGAAMVAGNAFVELAERVQENSPNLHAIDQEVHTWAAYGRDPGATPFFTVMTVIGTPVGLGVLATIFSIALILRKRWRWAAYLFLTSAIGGLLNLQLKAWFARARPELAEALRDAHGYSFPSGHAMGSTVVFGALAYLAFRILVHWRWRAAALALSATMIAGISASRIYLGVHWISDVAAGIAAGAIWLAAVTVAYETFRRIRLVRELRSRHDEALSSERTSRGE
jgi:undecaprenyl-diphosphatase